MKILIVEDDKVMNQTLGYNLSSEGYDVSSAYNFKEADRALAQNKFQLIVLDVNLPDGNGFDLCKKWCKTIKTHIVFLTANDLESDMLKGFELGAEDYITKPFHISVFLKKIAVLTKNTKGGIGKHIYDDGHLVIDFARRKASLREKEIELSTSEYNMIDVLLKNCHMVLTRQVLLEKLWDSNENFVDENALTMMISRIRTKIDSKEMKYIKTIYGMGYQWIGEPNEE
ncbi:response regulator transcription factor [Acetobacterium bakii]|uniref:Stage 0 sporulation protein A homolog n=1 Tax=Acetobacterium bakii TaxID=52689 RepID=A0A0L6TYE0_9FIRM|nr:response regulator transcription factor [Acetobacterium bakii]KNZ41276.1 transcriptional regulator [Acetobacterium bakii]